ncbi:hypothetical protein MA16_Dca002656 [Dendrobium catenatum]|uniref:Uncharacterized protein n=1 Tax=Dendrobium catenatum TaxID=906689 RepID=A0A2I0W151_9ASPA|nr:hypothetical protein MA16_Dca002656 [Dendrobium catenatum]
MNLQGCKSATKLSKIYKLKSQVKPQAQLVKESVNHRFTGLGFTTLGPSAQNKPSEN